MLLSPPNSHAPLTRTGLTSRLAQLLKDSRAVKDIRTSDGEWWIATKFAPNRASGKFWPWKQDSSRFHANLSAVERIGERFI